MMSNNCLFFSFVDSFGELINWRYIEMRGRETDGIHGRYVVHLYTIPFSSLPFLQIMSCFHFPVSN